MNKILTVSQLNNYVKNVFDDELILHNITVEGEVFEAKFSAGNTYLTLKEGEYVLSCVRFGGRLEFEVGDKLHVTGSMRFYPRGGKVTFVVTYATAVGKGDLLVKFNELKEKLSKQGVFENFKKLPQFIKKIALITSTEGAVIHDFLEVLSRNGCEYIDIDVYGVKVQGLGADETIVKALSSINGKNYDAVVIARGGGSGQDLNCFNTELIARAVFENNFPVISAVGHQTDYTLCDFASSLRAGTPSIAAEKIVRNNEEFVSRFYGHLAIIKARVEGLFNQTAIKTKRLSADLTVGCQQKMSTLKNKAVAYIAKMLGDLQSKMQNNEQFCRSNLQSLYRFMESKIALSEQELRLTSTVLDKTSPLKILSDGYAKVLKNGKSVDSAKEVNLGDNIKIVLSGGTLTATVTDKE